MKIQQISLFVENKPGHITGPMRLLAANGIDLRALHLADSEKYGILRMIVNAPVHAAKVLGLNDYIVKTTEVLAVEVPDQPGGLAQILDALDGGEINIEYLYAFPGACNGKAVLIFRFTEIDKAIACLQAAGINPLTSSDLQGA